jgi:hypothetical protein
MYLCFSSKKKHANDNNKDKSEKNFKSKNFLKIKEFSFSLSQVRAPSLPISISITDNTHTQTMRVTICTRDALKLLYMRVKFVLPIFVSSFQQTKLPLSKNELRFLGFHFFFVSFCLFLNGARRLPQTRARRE